ncbi:hypothetical protein COS83_00295 [archaeon CG07_land_8_20_14_0_80_38_8]|nr:MAG: hypothetical protein COS83_00295 [archaeon CG07_land_8_20_14_0_80_38_8]PIU88539.1 MAG: hypothetical protein COS64_03505 [archaeon CG06_land_8_20_14_3_00_37_11]
MKIFCQECNNLLLGRDGMLYCSTCNISYKINESDKQLLTLKKKIVHNEKYDMPLIIRNSELENSLQKEDTKALYEQFKEYNSTN